MPIIETAIKFFGISFTIAFLFSDSRNKTDIATNDTLCKNLEKNMPAIHTNSMPNPTFLICFIAKIFAQFRELTTQIYCLSI